MESVASHGLISASSSTQRLNAACCWSVGPQLYCPSQTTSGVAVCSCRGLKILSIFSQPEMLQSSCSFGKYYHPKQRKTSPQLNLDHSCNNGKNKVAPMVPVENSCSGKQPKPHRLWRSKDRRTWWRALVQWNGLNPWSYSTIPPLRAPCCSASQPSMLAARTVLFLSGRDFQNLLPHQNFCHHQTGSSWGLTYERCIRFFPCTRRNVLKSTLRENGPHVATFF